MNYLPILVATVVAFGIGALWYSPILFGREWMTLTKMTEADMEAARERGVFKLYVVQLIITFIMFMVVGFVMSGFFTAVNIARTGANGAFIAAILWLGFIATEAIGSMIWERKPFKLILIQSVGMLLNLVVGGAIMGAWH